MTEKRETGGWKMEKGEKENKQGEAQEEGQKIAKAMGEDEDEATATRKPHEGKEGESERENEANKNRGGKNKMRFKL